MLFTFNDNAETFVQLKGGGFTLKWYFITLLLFTHPDKSNICSPFSSYFHFGLHQRLREKLAT